MYISKKIYILRLTNGEVLLHNPAFMNRRESIKTLAISAVVPSVLLHTPAFGKNKNVASFKSHWQQWPNMAWTGPEYWGNRLQDWQIKDGKAVCVVSGPDRSLHCLTTQLSGQSGSFETSVIIELLNQKTDKAGESYVGFRLGAKGPFADYRSAAVFGQGLEAGITTEGKLFIGDQMQEQPLKTGDKVKLHLQATPAQNGYQLKLTASDPAKDQPQGSFSIDNIPAEALVGNVALVAHMAEGEASGKPSATFADWTMQGDKLVQDENQAFGPVCFAQYTLHQGILKLNAQLAPIEAIKDHQVALQIKQTGKWETVQQGKTDPLGRVAQFRIENWKNKTAVPYRIRVMLPLSSGRQEYFYEGTIAHEPLAVDQVKVAIFSCNADYGFPDNEVAPPCTQTQT